MTMMDKKAKWITLEGTEKKRPLTFAKNFSVKKKLLRATLSVSSVGIYDAFINGVRVGDAVLMPGWTSYQYRIQYQTYDVTALTKAENRLEIGVGNGWAVGRIGCGDDRRNVYGDSVAVIASLTLSYEDAEETVVTDEDWHVYSSEVLFTDIYDGEWIDKTAPIHALGNASVTQVEGELVGQVGEWITEQERLAPVEVIRTPKGETVLDFGQNMTGYVELRIKAARGSRILLHHGEVLDMDGNFYNANLRSAKSEDLYVCSGEEDVFKPRYTYHGFRYVRLTEYPLDAVDPASFRAIVVHSQMKRTGDFVCGNEKINQLYHNIIWGQKSNYLDIPTDCPQRNERLGWTGDAQVFCRTAAINYDVENFFDKWLGDMALEQYEDGGVSEIIPRCFPGRGRISAAWADAACVIPWEIYMAYGSTEMLEKYFPMMKKWVEYMHHAGPEEYLWLEGHHYGDWLAMDHGEDSYVGATSTDLIASAYFAHSASLLVRAGKALGYDMREYEDLHCRVVAAFRERYLADGNLRQLPDLAMDDAHAQKNPPNETQTAYALILAFGLCREEDRLRFADRLAAMIRENGTRMTTGFVGTPYLLHALSENGHGDLAYDLLFREQSPSWLYSVTHGATTMWEHWNSQKEDGSFWSTDMNSFNHYAYGAVYDWIFGKSVGIVPISPAYRRISLTPHPDRRLGFAKASIESRSGRIVALWYYKGDTVYYEFEIPDDVKATLTLPSGYREELNGGTYHFAEKETSGGNIL
ncbi:MAG: alfa-L-rhamnosidase [Ruminococcaceae bacterium]|nr:alfa-L-rhamnosidase [Oscillospiraceae bacterium]